MFLSARCGRRELLAIGIRIRPTACCSGGRLAAPRSSPATTISTRRNGRRRCRQRRIVPGVVHFRGRGSRVGKRKTKCWKVRSRFYRIRLWEPDLNCSSLYISLSSSLKVCTLLHRSVVSRLFPTLDSNSSNAPHSTVAGLFRIITFRNVTVRLSYSATIR